MESLKSQKYVPTALIDLAQDSYRLVKKCSKPDAKEFKRIATACAGGFAIMGVLGYVIKLVFIPVNNILIRSN